VIPAAYFCEVAARSQVEKYSTCNSIMILSFLFLHGQERKYFEENLKFGFTSIAGKSTEKPQRVLCNVVLNAEFVKPSKFMRHLETKPSKTSQRIWSSFQPIVVQDSLPAVYCCLFAINIQEETYCSVMKNLSALSMKS